MPTPGSHRPIIVGIQLRRCLTRLTIDLPNSRFCLVYGFQVRCMAMSKEGDQHPGDKTYVDLAGDR